MNPNGKYLLLCICTILSASIVIILKPIPQDPAYHLFADHRVFWGIPNFWNVLTNLPFIVIGILGISRILKSKTDVEMKWIYGVLCAGILLTGFGSAYYHYSPDTDSLIFDRIPMTIVFMSLLTATVAELINRTFAKIIFIPLLLLGVASVVWWHHTELAGKGDLRLYGMVQFYPALMIPINYYALCLA